MRTQYFGDISVTKVLDGTEKFKAATAFPAFILITFINTLIGLVLFMILIVRASSLAPILTLLKPQSSQPLSIHVLVMIKIE